MTKSLSDIISQRDALYGGFERQAIMSQSLKSLIQNGRSYHNLTPSQKEALEMILHKIARIINGDTNYADSWLDIAGYATLQHNILTNGERHESEV